MFTSQEINRTTAHFPVNRVTKHDAGLQSSALGYVLIFTG